MYVETNFDRFRVLTGIMLNTVAENLKLCRGLIKSCVQHATTFGKPIIIPDFRGFLQEAFHGRDTSGL